MIVSTTLTVGQRILNEHNGSAYYELVGEVLEMGAEAVTIQWGYGRQHPYLYSNSLWAQCVLINSNHIGNSELSEGVRL